MFSVRNLAVASLPLCLVMVVNSAYAQSATSVPQGALNLQRTIPQGDTGAILQDLERKNIAPELPINKNKKRPDATVDDQREQPKPLTEGEQSDQKILIKQITLQDETLLEDENVQALIHSYENRELTFSELQELTDKLTTLYQEKGYATSRVIIPPQKLTEGSLVLQAVEGKVGTVSIAEGRYFKDQSVKPFISIKSGEPLNLTDLKDDIRQLNLNPDRSVQATLKPGSEAGTSDVDLKITDRLPLHIVPTFDNLGRRLIGDNRLGLRLSHDNIFGIGDQFSSAVSFTRRSFGVVNRYEAPINSHGTRIGIEHGYTSLKLGEEFKSLNVESRAQTFSPFISQSFINTDKYRLYGDLAFDIKMLDTDIQNQDAFNDNLRVLRPGINFEEYDRGGRTFIRSEIGLGLDIFGGSNNTRTVQSRSGAGSQFIRYSGAVIRTQRLPWNSFGIFRAYGQVSPDRLVSLEQFQAGGALSVRGYREGRIIGDNGVVLSAEWRVPFYPAPKDFRFPFAPNYSIRDNVQLTSFLDYGFIDVNRPVAGDPQSSEQILGTGVGLRFRLSQYMVGRLDLGFPLLKQEPNSNSARLHFGIESNIF